MANYTIPDSSIQASSSHNQNLVPSNGRLHKGRSDGGTGSWTPLFGDENPWFQVDFGNWTKVSGIATQGRAGINQWVTKYRVSYSYDGLLFAGYKEGSDDKVPS